MCASNKIDFSEVPYVTSYLVVHTFFPRQPMSQDNQWVFDDLLLMFPSLSLSIFDRLLPSLTLSTSPSDASSTTVDFSTAFEDLLRVACLSPSNLTLDYFCQVFPDLASLLREHEQRLLFDSRLLPSLFFFLVCKYQFDYCHNLKGDHLEVYRTLLTMLAWFFAPLFYTLGFLGKEYPAEESHSWATPVFGFFRLQYSRYSLFLPFINIDQGQSVFYAHITSREEQHFPAVPPSLVSLLIPDEPFRPSVSYSVLSHLLFDAFFFYFFSFPSLESDSMLRVFVREISFFDFPNFYVLEPALALMNEDADALVRRAVLCNSTVANIPLDYLRLKFVPMFRLSNLVSPGLLRPETKSKPAMGLDRRANYDMTLFCNWLLNFGFGKGTLCSHPYVLASSIGIKDRR